MHRLIVGFSVDRRPIRAYVIGHIGARPSVLVVGCVHGNETAGEAISAQLRHAIPPRGVALWLVDEFNPDGCTAHTRQNARGVDLNRNSPWHWRRLDHPGGTYYSGPGPLSEPESRAINRLVRRLRPNISLWYHQHAALVDESSGGNVGLERRYAELAGPPLRNYGVYPGSITSWQDATFPNDTAFVVELPAGTLSRSEVARHRRAVFISMSSERPKISFAKRRPIFTPEQIEQTLRAAAEPYRTLFTLAALTGARVSELLGLTWADVRLDDLNDADIMFAWQVDRQGNRRPTKTDGFERTVPIAKELAVVLARHKLASSDIRPEAFVFATRSGRPLGQRNVARALRNAQERAKDDSGQPTFPVLHQMDANSESVPVPAGTLPSMHSFRHTVASRRYSPARASTRSRFCSDTETRPSRAWSTSTKSPTPVGVICVGRG